MKRPSTAVPSTEAASAEHSHGHELQPDWPLLLMLGFGLVWIFHRAWVQSISLDEANTFLRWVAPDGPTHWVPHSNNHVLNSLLMRLSVWLFGPTHFTIRLPALVGSVIYLASAFALSRVLIAPKIARWATFVCFAYNPFIMDYLVAARGYGLALGFLTMALYLHAKALLFDEPSPNEIVPRSTLALSASAGLAVSASFTFSYAAFFLLIAHTALQTMKALRLHHGVRQLTVLWLSAGLPALAALLLFAGSALMDFPRDQLFWGTDSLLVAWRDLRDGSFLELNPYLVNPLLARMLDFAHRHLFEALFFFAVGFLWTIAKSRTEVIACAYCGRRLIFSGSLLAVLFLTVLSHWLQFKLFQIPLPYERTAIFVLPVATAVICSALAIQLSSRLHRAVRGLGVAIISVSSLYFVGELRDSFFREWRDCAELQSALPLAVNLCQRFGTRELVADDNLASSLEFYRVTQPIRELDKILKFDDHPRGKPVYLLLENRSRPFIDSEHLVIVWRGAISGTVIATRP